MKNVGKLAMGAGLAATASYVWTLVPYSETFRLASNPLAFMEHYHYALAAVIVGRKVKRAKKYKPFLYGFGAGMVAIEAAGSQPFGVGKPLEQFIPSVLIGAVELTYLLW